MLSESHLSFLVNDWHSVLQLHVIKQAGQEDISHSDQTVIDLLVEERVCSFKVRTHHL